MTGTSLDVSTWDVQVAQMLEMAETSLDVSA